MSNVRRQYSTLDNAWKHPKLIVKPSTQQTNPKTSMNQSNISKQLNGN